MIVSKLEIVEARFLHRAVRNPMMNPYKSHGVTIKSSKKHPNYPKTAFWSAFFFFCLPIFCGAAAMFQPITIHYDSRLPMFVLVFGCILSTFLTCFSVFAALGDMISDQEDRSPWFSIFALVFAIANFPMWLFVAYILGMTALAGHPI